MNNRAHRGQNEFKKFNWVRLNDSFEQIVSLMSCKFYSNTTSPYINDVFKAAGHNNTIFKSSLLKLNQTLGKANQFYRSFFYIALIIWKNLSDFLKQKQKALFINLIITLFM